MRAHAVSAGKVKWMKWMLCRYCVHASNTRSCWRLLYQNTQYHATCDSPSCSDACAVVHLGPGMCGHAPLAVRDDAPNEAVRLHLKRSHIVPLHSSRLQHVATTPRLRHIILCSVELCMLSVVICCECRTAVTALSGRSLALPAPLAPAENSGGRE